ncbi:choice-of-anchor J domain-containing protein [Flavobacterium sp.]|uniref:choice-of-anchor J domain-containing protein n=1 Tax=Flavobacterium sp. TaxID=239 RepID=UPI00374D54E7
MKTNKIIMILGVATLLGFASCSPEQDIKNPDFTPLTFAEDFSVGAVDNTELNTQGWFNYAEVGTAKWREQIYSSNPYAEFSSFSSGNAINVGWLISPAINMDLQDRETLVFQSAQSYVSSSANSLEVFISKDFNGTNVLTATWEPLTATLPLTTSVYFQFINSGEIDLSGYTGNIHIAFKVKGSGTNLALDGSYQVDNIRIFNKK